MVFKPYLVLNEEGFWKWELGMRKKKEGVKMRRWEKSSTSFGYFDNQAENEKVLQAISSYLKLDGILIIDYLNAHGIIKSLPLEETITSENITFHVRKFMHDQTIKKEIRFEDKGEKFQFSEQVQAFEQQNFINMLEKTGFKVLGVYGDYDLSSFNQEKSPRLIIKAKLV